MKKRFCGNVFHHPSDQNLPSPSNPLHPGKDEDWLSFLRGPAPMAEASEPGREHVLQPGPMSDSLKRLVSSPDADLLGDPRIPPSQLPLSTQHEHALKTFLALKTLLAERHSLGSCMEVAKCCVTRWKSKHCERSETKGSKTGNERGLANLGHLANVAAVHCSEGLESLMNREPVKLVRSANFKAVGKEGCKEEVTRIKSLCFNAFRMRQTRVNNKVFFEHKPLLDLNGETIL